MDKETAALAAEIHEAWEFQYDECDHGTYTGGAQHGEPYAMCELTAARIIRRRWEKRDSEICGVARPRSVNPAGGVCIRLKGHNGAHNAESTEDPLFGGGN